MGKKITQEEFINRVKDKLGFDYEVLGQYEGRDIPVLMKHYVCGNTFMKRPHDITSKGSGCPFCNGSRPAKYNENWVIENTPPPYKYVSGYTTMKTKCQFYCSNCNQYFEQMPSRLINQHIYGCGCCKTKKKTHEDFLEEIKDVLNEYEVLEEYQNIDTPIKFRHLCGCEFEISPYKFIHRHDKKYCPICYYKKSKGEISIGRTLNELNIEFHKEFIFPDLPRKKFDFFLPEYNAVIEYDGAQHYYEIPFLNQTRTLQEIQQADQEKNQFCINNNIHIYRIPYCDYDDISQIICKIFKEKSSTTIEKYKITEQSRI